MRGRGLGLICALRQECRCLLAHGGWRRLPARLPEWEHEERGAGGRTRLVISGMGGKRAEAGLELLLEGFDPEAVISFGFGGALDPALRVGDLIWGKEVFRWEEGKGVSGELKLTAPSEALLEKASPPAHWRDGFLVSVEGFVPKARVRGALDSQLSPALLEMETYALAAALKKRGLPLLGLRAVSDEWGLEAGRVVGRWMDETLRVRPGKMLLDLFFHPWRAMYLCELMERSWVAARALGRAIPVVLGEWEKGGNLILPPV